MIWWKLSQCKSLLLLWWVHHICLPHRVLLREGVHPRRPFKWDQDSWQWKLLPFTFPSGPQTSSLTSCCRASAIHISLRIQQGVSGSRLRVGTLINQSRWEVAWWDLIHSQGRNACFSLLFAWTEFTRIFMHERMFYVLWYVLWKKWYKITQSSRNEHSFIKKKPSTLLITRCTVTTRKPVFTWGKDVTNTGRNHLRAPSPTGSSVCLGRAGL